MANVRMSRIDAEIQKAVAGIINDKLEHPSVKGVMVTVLHVETTPDLLLSTIYVSVYGGEDKIIVDALNASKNYIRKELSRVIRLRTIPDLKFVLDTTLQYTQHMDKLFESIHQERE